MKTKTQEQIISNCTNKHDKELMIKSFDRFNDTYSKATFCMWIATFFTILGFFGMFILRNDYFVLSFTPVFPLTVIAMIYNIKSVGLC